MTDQVGRSQGPSGSASAYRPSTRSANAGPSISATSATENRNWLIGAHVSPRAPITARRRTLKHSPARGGCGSPRPSTDRPASASHGLGSDPSSNPNPPALWTKGSFVVRGCRIDPCVASRPAAKPRWSRSNLGGLSLVRRARAGSQGHNGPRHVVLSEPVQRLALIDQQTGARGKCGEALLGAVDTGLHVDLRRGERGVVE